jgi:hypothetical protein
MNKYSTTIKLVKQAEFIFRTNAKQVYIDHIQESGLRFAKDSDFDRWLEKNVSIIRPTEDDRDRDTGFLNGRKTAFVDFNKGEELPRFTDLELDVILPDGKPETARGQVKITYRNQPVFCRICKTEHIGRCPVREAEEAKKEAEDRARQPKIKTLLVGDSNLRHVNEQGTTSSTRVATGAKIGHAANVLRFEEPTKYDNVIIHAGGNNIIPQAVNFAVWENQVRSEIEQLQSQLIRFSGTKTIIGVANSEQATANDQTIKMRTTLNEELRNLQSTIDNTKYVYVDDELGDQEEAWVDYRHYSEIMCAKVLEAVDNTFPEDQKLLIRGKPSTTPRKYGNVNSAYKLGCGTCTKLGHLEEECPKSIGNNKRAGRPSGGATSPPSKKK